jgi:hypothetical protein
MTVVAAREIEKLLNVALESALATCSTPLLSENLDVQDSLNGVDAAKRRKLGWEEADGANGTYNEEAESVEMDVERSSQLADRMRAPGNGVSPSSLPPAVAESVRSAPTTWIARALQEPTLEASVTSSSSSGILIDALIQCISHQAQAGLLHDDDVADVILAAAIPALVSVSMKSAADGDNAEQVARAQTWCRRQIRLCVEREPAKCAPFVSKAATSFLSDALSSDDPSPGCLMTACALASTRGSTPSSASSSLAWLPEMSYFLSRLQTSSHPSALLRLLRVCAIAHGISFWSEALSSSMAVEDAVGGLLRLSLQCGEYTWVSCCAQALKQAANGLANGASLGGMTEDQVQSARDALIRGFLSSVNPQCASGRGIEKAIADVIAIQSDHETCAEWLSSNADALARSAWTPIASAGAGQDLGDADFDEDASGGLGHAAVAGIGLDSARVLSSLISLSPPLPTGPLATLLDSIASGYPLDVFPPEDYWQEGADAEDAEATDVRPSRLHESGRSLIRAILSLFVDSVSNGTWFDMLDLPLALERALLPLLQPRLAPPVGCDTEDARLWWRAVATTTASTALRRLALRAPLRGVARALMQDGSSLWRTLIKVVDPSLAPMPCVATVAALSSRVLNPPDEGSDDGPSPILNSLLEEDEDANGMDVDEAGAPALGNPAYEDDDMLQKIKLPPGMWRWYRGATLLLISMDEGSMDEAFTREEKMLARAAIAMGEALLVSMGVWGEHAPPPPEEDEDPEVERDWTATMIRIGRIIKHEERDNALCGRAVGVACGVMGKRRPRVMAVEAHPPSVACSAATASSPLVTCTAMSSSIAAVARVAMMERERARVRSLLEGPKTNPKKSTASLSAFAAKPATSSASTLGSASTTTGAVTVTATTRKAVSTTAAATAKPASGASKPGSAAAPTAASAVGKAKSSAVTAIVAAASSSSSRPTSPATSTSPVGAASSARSATKPIMPAANASSNDMEEEDVTDKPNPLAAYANATLNTSNNLQVPSSSITSTSTLLKPPSSAAGATGPKPGDRQGSVVVDWKFASMILNWSYERLEDETISGLQAIPQRFTSYEQYSEVFRPLVLLEALAQLQQAKQEMAKETAIPLDFVEMEYRPDNTQEITLEVVPPKEEVAIPVPAAAEPAGPKKRKRGDDSSNKENEEGGGASKGKAFGGRPADGGSSGAIEFEGGEAEQDDAAPGTTAATEAIPAPASASASAGTNGVQGGPGARRTSSRMRGIAEHDILVVFPLPSGTSLDENGVPTDPRLYGLEVEGQENAGSEMSTVESVKPFLALVRRSTRRTGRVLLRTVMATDASVYRTASRWVAHRLASLVTSLREMQALNSMPSMALKETILDPLMTQQSAAKAGSAISPMEIALYKKKFELNDPQAKAVCMALKNQRGFTLVQGTESFLREEKKRKKKGIENLKIYRISNVPIYAVSQCAGPPGTGKTKTILSIISCFLSGAGKKIAMPMSGGGGGGGGGGSGGTLIGAVPLTTKRGAAASAATTANAEVSSGRSDLPKILVCAPSNAAVDEIARRLLVGVSTLAGAAGDKIVPRIVRVGVHNSVHPDVRSRSFEFLTQEKLKDAKAQQKYLKIVEDENDARSRVRTFPFHFNFCAIVLICHFSPLNKKKKKKKTGGESCQAGGRRYAPPCRSREARRVDCCAAGISFEANCGPSKPGGGGAGPDQGQGGRPNCDGGDDGGRVSHQGAQGGRCDLLHPQRLCHRAALRRRVWNDDC